MIDTIKKVKCTGCNACSNICPEQCISMVADKDGFWYPKVDYTACTKCGLCIKTCPALNGVKTSNIENPNLYAAWSNDKDIVRNSSSGGLFSELAKWVLAANGYVVGAAFTKDHLVAHYMIDNIKDIGILQQSKYLQSDIGDMYTKVKQKLNQGSRVLFCGTSCQVGGLLNFLKKDYANLIAVDFICGGVNSPKAYLSYLDMLKEKYKSDITKISFRDKDIDWISFNSRVEFKDKQIYKDVYTSDIFMNGFIKYKLFTRPCCFECDYRTLPRVADITLGDFWGIDKVDAAFENKEGTSLIMINSKKGRGLFDSIKENIFHKQCTIDDALPGNPCIFHPTERIGNSKKFFRLLQNNSFEASYNKCSNPTISYKANKLRLKITSKAKRMLKIK